MGSLLYYKAFLLATTEASLDLGKDIQISHMTDVTAKTEDIITQPVRYESVALYNTQNGFASFLVPAILILVIQQTLLLGIGMLAATAREKNYGKQLVPVDNRHEGTFRVVFGKALAYLLIYVPVCIWTLLIVPHIFNLPRIAQPGTITLFILPYLFASIFFAMSISCFMKERENSMLLLVFTSLPLLFISGVSWPGSEISPFWQWVGTLIPSTLGIQGFIRVNSMGAGLSEIAREYNILWILTGVYFILTCILYRWQIIKASKFRKRSWKK
jgi:ABC-2 type transport system permease protein